MTLYIFAIEFDFIKDIYMLNILFSLYIKFSLNFFFILYIFLYIFGLIKTLLELIKTLLDFIYRTAPGKFAAARSYRATKIVLAVE